MFIKCCWIYWLKREIYRALIAETSDQLCPISRYSVKRASLSVNPNRLRGSENVLKSESNNRAEIRELPPSRIRLIGSVVLMGSRQDFRVRQKFLIGPAQNPNNEDFRWENNSKIEARGPHRRGTGHTITDVRYTLNRNRESIRSYCVSPNELNAEEKTQLLFYLIYILIRKLLIAEITFEKARRGKCISHKFFTTFAIVYLLLITQNRFLICFRDLRVSVSILRRTLRSDTRVWRALYILYILRYSRPVFAFSAAYGYIS